MKKYLSLILLMCSSLWLSAQNAGGPEMADVMRSNGKLYVVVAVLVLIFIGIIFYLIGLDRRIKSLEDDI